MSVRESPRRFVVAVTGVGVLAWALTVFFLFVYPLLALPETAEPAYLDAWFPVGAAGGSITTYGVLLVAVSATVIGVVGALLLDASRPEAVE